MYKAAVIGDYDSIYGFAALGLDTFPTTSAEQAAAEALAAELREELDAYRTQQLPAIILIPGVSGNTGAGIAMVKKSVEQAVGSDIIFNNQN